MILLVIADDESAVRQLPPARADVLVSCGDLPDELILHCAAACQASRIFAVKGKRDPSAGFPPQITDLHLTTARFRNVRFGGFCGAWRYKPRGNYLFEQAEVEQGLINFPAVDIFVAHNSPRLIHDQDDDIRVGFVAFLRYLERAKPRLFLHGHQQLHRESQVGATRVIGTCGHRYLVWPEP